MKPIDIRDENWNSLQLKLREIQASVLVAWKIHGPGTTRDVSERAGMDLLTFRPRTTELYQLGLVECSGVSEGQGIYRVRTEQAWQAWALAHRAATTNQLQLV